MNIDLSTYKKLYLCDERKNVKCHQTECHKFGGICYHTLDKSCQLTGIRKLALATKYKLDRRTN